MSTREEWNRLINLSHEMALIEADLRRFAAEENYNAAQTVLWDHFGVDVDTP